MLRGGAAFILIAESGNAGGLFGSADFLRASGFLMSERQQNPYDSIARRWLALVERRQAHFIELCDTGRWRHYYSEPEFIEEMRKVLRLRRQWATITGIPSDDEDLPPGAKGVPPRPPELSAEVPALLWPD
jgi:hypothetical protein